jgi:hypothetical protein
MGVGWRATGCPEVPCQTDTSTTARTCGWPIYGKSSRTEGALRSAIVTQLPGAPARPPMLTASPRSPRNQHPAPRIRYSANSNAAVATADILYSKLSGESSSAAPNSDPRKCVWFAWRSLGPGEMRQVADGFSIVQRNSRAQSGTAAQHGSIGQ